MVALGAGSAIVFVVTTFLLSAIDRGSLAEDSPIEYLGPWQPTQSLYHPGEPVEFVFTRRASLRGEMKISILAFSCFRDLETGITYGADEVTRPVLRDGIESGPAVRVLPLNARPTRRMVLEGLVFSFPARRTRPVDFTSAEFIVEASETVATRR